MIIYVCGKYDSFLGDYLSRLDCDIVKVERFDPIGAAEADVVWCEWGDENAIDVSLWNSDTKRILRIHRYEIYRNLVHYIKYEAFDKVVFVAKHELDHFERLVKKIPNSMIIGNGIDLSKYKFTPVENNKIGWLGYIHGRKGLNLLLFLAETFKDYEFHVAGKVQELELGFLLEKKKPENVVYHKWVDSVGEFYADKTYVLSTSYSEGTQLSLLEGMACGCVPLIYNWVGADELYPKEYVYKNFMDFARILTQWHDKERLRNYVEINYNIENKFQQMKEILCD